MLVGQGEAGNSCHFVIRSSIAQKCNYHGTRFCADVHVSARLFVVVAACVDRVETVGGGAGTNGEVRCNSQASADIREVSRPRILVHVGRGQVDR